MMNIESIVEYIKLKKELISFCEKRIEFYKTTDCLSIANQYELEKRMLTTHVQNAELLLKTDTGAIVKDAPFCKRCDGGSTDMEGTATLEEPAGADFNEVRADGGNKQTQKVCQCPLFLDVNNGNCTICGLPII